MATLNWPVVAAIRTIFLQEVCWSVISCLDEGGRALLRLWLLGLLIIIQGRNLSIVCINGIFVTRDGMLSRLEIGWSLGVMGISPLG